LWQGPRPVSFSDLKNGNSEADELLAEVETTRNITGIDASVLEVGDIVFVCKGSSPPEGGVIAFGDSSFDDSSLTGVSKAITKGPPGEVFLGTINQGHPIHIRVSRLDGQKM
jgi:P-type Cu+ transporter